MSTAQGSWRGPKIIKDGLILYLNPSSPNSYRPTNNSSLYDISSSGVVNRVDFFNALTRKETNGGILLFDGVDDYAKTSSTFALHKDMTYSFWVNHQQRSYIQTFIGDGGQNLTLGFIWIWRNDNTDQLLLSYAAGEVTNQAITSPSFFTGFDNTWVNIVITVSYSISGVCKFYRNGVEVTSTNLVGVPVIPRNLNKFFGSYSTLSNRLNGGMGEVLLYNKILTSDEILQNFNETKSRFGL
jgi:hypothetical protein